MSEYLVLVCNQCKKEKKERDAVGWFHIRIVGLDTTTFSDAPLPADLCSILCIRDYLTSRDPKRRR
jgi:hypothetical protein